MRPRIAVTTSSHIAAEYRTPQVVLGSPYLEAVERVSATPLLVTPAHGKASIAELMELVDGLLLTGGEDIDPSRYGQRPHAKLETVNHARDVMELEVLRRALEARMPVLAICRGLQLLNVHFGGTLVQDLPSERPGGLIHEQQAPITDHWHGARVESGSRLARILGSESLQINSFHHQGIERLGAGLRPLAWAEDGLIEAVEAVDHPWVIGVQWHPERAEAEVPDTHTHPDWRLFSAFGEEARRFRSERVRAAA